MPEGVTAYPRWDGALDTGRTFAAIARQEIRRAVNNTWSRLAFMLVFAFTIVYLGQLYTLFQQSGNRIHTMDNYLDFLNGLEWAALAIAATMGGPSILEDVRRGAIELYLSRAVTFTDYLLGKTLAILGVTTLAMIGPALLYWMFTFVIFTDHPKDWGLVPFQAALYGLLWALLVSGIALGLSCALRSSRGATLILLGGFALLDVVISNLLSNITKNPNLQVLSPFSAFNQQSEWIFGLPPPFKFPVWWGLAGILGLTILGWALMAWRRPRMAGESRGGA